MESKLFHGYRVTSDGVIYQRRFPNKPMKTQLKCTGYALVTLHSDKVRTATVHRLVWEAFNGAVPDGLQINHIDGNKLNNALSNLELVTPKQNIAHAFDNGLIVPKKDSYAKTAKANHKIDDLQASEMKRLHESGLSMRKIAAKFDCHHKTVSGVVNQVGCFRARPDNRNKDWGLTK